MTADAINSLPAISGKVFDDLPVSIRSYIYYLETTIQEQQKHIQEQKVQIQALQIQVKELEARLSKNSSNSSKPPSSDGLKRKPKSLRNKSDKKQGAQKGRIGKGLTQVSNPDKIVVHAPSKCSECGCGLEEGSGVLVETRQIFDIPLPKVEVVEHRSFEKKCSCCGIVNRGSFPDNIKGPVQYGGRVQALVAYFSHRHFIPVDRVCEIFEDIFGIELSPGTCANVDERLFEKLGTFESSLKAYLLAARILHFDETGMRCEKKLHWVHVASSQMATLYTIHAKRGQEAMEEAGILPLFQGTAIHDHWFPYFAYAQVKHSLCNAHHLRELTFIHEQAKEEWAKEMKDLLIFANDSVEKHVGQGTLPAQILLHIEQTYAIILNKGFAYHSLLPPLSRGRRGRQKQRDGKNLLDRLSDKRDCVLLFMYDFSVPFTNNQGERDIRMVKLKQKISGCFRKPLRGAMFCRIRSYISTAYKQGWNIWDALAEAIKGAPRLLEIKQVIPSQELAV